MKEVEFNMPSLGADMDAGTITEWLIEVGDEVERGQVVAIVESDKADIDIEIWNSGVVTDIMVPIGESVSVGTPLARLEVGDGEAGRDDAIGADGMADELPMGTESDGADRQPIAGHADPVRRVRASPLARRLAAEAGIDLNTIGGTGPGGAVIAQDTTGTRRPDAVTVSGSDRRRDRGSGTGASRTGEGMRRAIGDLMARSKREIPHYYLATDIDLESALEWLESLNSQRSVEERVLPAAVLLKAVAAAVVEHPEFNGFWIDDRFRPGDGVHLGVAVSLRGGGLVAPAIHHADRLAVPDLMTALRDLVGRARSGRLRASEMTDSTITVTNLGDRGVELVHGVIYPPQVALVGMGSIVERPAVVAGSIMARRQVSVTLAADHRASDGQRGARLLNAIARLLEEPEEL